jgi:membrane dipeptidase
MKVSKGPGDVITQDMRTRRQFISDLAAIPIAAGVVSASKLQSDRHDAPVTHLPKRGAYRVDALCYEPILTASAVENAINGGLTAAVLDINASPREFVYAVRELSRWKARFNNAGGRFVSVLKASDFDRARTERKLGIVLACQDASILGSSLAEWQMNLNLFHGLGLRVLQLTHNARTHWADSFMEKRDGGLSRAGEQLVEEMNKLGMIIDLSHCSRQTLLDAVQISKKPCSVTHAGCRTLADTARNKSDEEIRAIGKAGGFFGVYNMTTWLTELPNASLDTVIRHIDHAVQLIGANRIGFGSDGALDKLDAASELTRMARVQKVNAGTPSAEWEVRHVRVPELNASDRLKVLAEALAKRGYKDAHIEGIIGTNFVNLLQTVCG